MIIGLSGKKQSGKDTIGKIIQYLIYKDIFNSHEDINFEANYINRSMWQIKWFAEPLKNCVCILLGCTRKQLEDNEFKGKPLGEEWIKWKVTRLNMIPPTHKYYSNGEEAIVEENRLGMFGQIEKVVMTPRLLLQLLGTECGRQIIHPNIWINALFADYIAKGYFTIGEGREDQRLPDYPNWIITDVRFENEVKAIKKREGLIIRIRRPMLPSQVDTHESEVALDNYDGFDATINNHSTVENLIVNVKAVLSTFNIIK